MNVVPVYVVKSSFNDEANHCNYEAFVCSLSKKCECTRSLVVKENHQVMAQFLSRRKHSHQEKMLLFIHQECKLFILENASLVILSFHAL